MATPDVIKVLEGGAFYADVDGLGASTDLDIDVAQVSNARVVVSTIVHGDACDVKLVRKDAGGTEVVVVTLDSLSGTGVSQGNEIPLDPGVPGTLLLRVTNTGSAADFAVMGEVAD